MATFGEIRFGQMRFGEMKFDEARFGEMRIGEMRGHLVVSTYFLQINSYCNNNSQLFSNFILFCTCSNAFNYNLDVIVLKSRDNLNA